MYTLNKGHFSKVNQAFFFNKYIIRLTKIRRDQCLVHAQICYGKPCLSLLCNIRDSRYVTKGPKTAANNSFTCKWRPRLTYFGPYLVFPGYIVFINLFILSLREIENKIIELIKFKCVLLDKGLWGNLVNSLRRCYKVVINFNLCQWWRI